MKISKKSKSIIIKSFLFASLILLWEVYAIRLNNPLMFPTFNETIKGFFEVIQNGELVSRILSSLKVQVMGYVIGGFLALILTIFAISTRFGAYLLELLTAVFNPLPPIALLPLALLWFGLGYGSIVFVIVHAVLWPIAINIYSGFQGVSNTLKMVSKNYELSTFEYIFKIAIPAAFPNILTGLKVGWAFSWRTLIASELVFGVSSGNGGIGWFIYEKKNQLDINLVFAGLLTIILIGIITDVIFEYIEKRTVVKWGMKTK
ncbi:ABC transporter permease [Aliarcobacter butzleri]|uniref:ABC transporter permease n=1 Tax=Aliarcobacter butzleri TaxID=28197 RepID=UPI00344E3DBB